VHCIEFEYASQLCSILRRSVPSRGGQPHWPAVIGGAQTSMHAAKTRSRPQFTYYGCLTYIYVLPVQLMWCFLMLINQRH